MTAKPPSLYDMHPTQIRTEVAIGLFLLDETYENTGRTRSHWSLLARKEQDALLDRAEELIQMLRKRGIDLR